MRHGAIPTNPMCEIERIESRPKKEPRALTPDERVELLRQLRADEKSVRRDLPDLVFFMLATGCRIGEALAVVWSEVNFEAGTVDISSTLIRVKGEGLLRKGTKSRAGERTLGLPVSAVAMLRRRFMSGARLDQPLFPDVLGGFRDPANVRRELREARGEEELGWITSHTFRKTAATILDEGGAVGATRGRPAGPLEDVDDAGLLPRPAVRRQTGGHGARGRVKGHAGR